MVETIKRLFGLTINHVFITSFPKFRRAVDELGCVYMGVDRRYFHVNEPGGEQYFEINLQPGYQRLCGPQALEFVANRHQDTSLIRDARDQRFLLEVKAQYGASLFENREKFERILGRTVQTDNTLHGSEQVLNLLELLVESNSKPVRQVPFNVTLLKTYDTASEQQIHESVQSFLHGTAPIRKPKLTNVSRSSSRAHHAAIHSSSAGLNLTPTTLSELLAARSQAPRLPFSLDYPRVRDSFAGVEPDTLRVYAIRDQKGHIHPIYVIAIDRGELGQFYDVQGTTWTDPPILSNPDQTVRAGARTYELFYSGEQVRVIAWHEGGAVYWIENTLTENISPRAMLAMAEQTLPVVHARSDAGVHTGLGALRGVTLPPRTVATTSLTSKAGALLGLFAVCIVAVLSVLLLRRQRTLNMLREQVAQAIALEGRQRPLFAAAGLSYADPAAASPSPPEVRPAPALISEAQPARTVYRTRRRLRKGMLAAAGVVVAMVLLALGYELLRSPSTAAGSSVPVAVFNATSTSGAARRIAARLTAERIQIGGTGNIDTSLSPDTHVLYPPGAEGEARRVARLLSGPPPTVEPIERQVRQAVGQHDEIVVVLD